MAMPWVPGPIIMFYNRNLMEQAGLDPDAPPQTWPELIEAAKAICALPDVDGAPIYGIALRTARNPNSAQWTIPIIYGHDGDVVDAEGNVTFDTPEVAAAYEWVKELTDSGCRPSGFTIDETRNTMAAGRAGFIFEGPWGRGLFNNLSGGAITTAADGDIWAAQMPMSPSGTRRTIGNPHEITISAGSENKEMAAEFIRHVIFDPEITTAYFEASSQLSTGSLPLLTSGVMGEDAYTQLFVEALPQHHRQPDQEPQVLRGDGRPGGGAAGDHPGRRDRRRARQRRAQGRADDEPVRTSCAHPPDPGGGAAPRLIPRRSPARFLVQSPASARASLSRARSASLARLQLTTTLSRVTSGVSPAAAGPRPGLPRPGRARRGSQF